MNSYFNSLLASRLKLTKEQLEKELNFKTWLYDFEKRKLEDLEKEIIDLEQKLNGKTEER